MRADTNQLGVRRRDDAVALMSDRQRTVAFDAAQRHTRRVRRLRTALPIVAALVGLGYLISSKLTSSFTIGNMRASIGAIEVSRDALRMVNPKIEGVNKKNGNYTVTADYADQKTDDPSIIELTQIKAELTSSDKGWSRLTSPSGVFNSKQEKLDMAGPILVGSSSGMTGQLADAAIDMKTNFIRTPNPVAFQLNGTSEIKARTLEIATQEKVALFSGDVRVHIERDAKQAPPRKNAGAGMSGLTLNASEPVDIASPQLKVFDGQKLAHFMGGVTALQGGSKLTSRELKVLYRDKGQSGSDAQQQAPGAADIRQIEAVGDVRVTSADREATGQYMLFDNDKQTVLLDQSVIVNQAGNILRGQKLIVDLASGISEFPPGGRVQGFLKARPEMAAKQPSAPKEQTASLPGGPAQFDLTSARGKPIDIDADALTVDDRNSSAVFRGDVRAVQGGMTMRSRELYVSYVSGGATGETKQPGAMGADIKTITAKGKVLITTDRQQNTTSDWAIYDAKAQTITIGGNVVLTQGENVIKGDRLVIDVNTGRSRFENEGEAGTRQRVQGLFHPKQQPDESGKDKPQTPSAPSN